MLARLQAHRWERPDWWLWIGSGVAWIVLVVIAVRPESVADHQVHAGTHVAHGAGGGVVSATAWWALMVVAMMVPMAARPARWLAHRSLARRRAWTVALHTGAYFGVWLVFGIALAALVTAVEAPVMITIGTLLGAAGWHMTPYRRRYLRRCGAGRAPAVRGWPADLDCIRAGARTGRRCLITCGPVMATMIATHHLAVMAAVTAVLVSERRPAPNPDERRPERGGTRPGRHWTRRRGNRRTGYELICLEPVWPASREESRS